MYVRFTIAIVLCLPSSPYECVWRCPWRPLRCSGGRWGESERPWSTGWVRVQRVRMARSGLGIAADTSASRFSHNYGFPLRRGSFLSSQAIFNEENVSGKNVLLTLAQVLPKQVRFLGTTMKSCSILFRSILFCRSIGLLNLK